ncbi:MAG: hypothetical protein KBS60_06750 [Phascolarctobacterium sp.]|nr:hypothetical protein [Candidatus Phascolarctobacterium caballi]
MTINLNGHQITKNTEAMTISTGGRTLKISGGTNTAGSMDTNFDLNDASGKLNVSGNTELTGNIDNAGTVAFAGTTSVTGTLSGAGSYSNSGTLTVADATKLTMTGTNGLANAGTLNLGEGELGANITGADGTTVIDGEVTSAKNIENKVTLADDKKLTNTGTISGEVTNAGTFITTADGITGGVKNTGSLELTGENKVLGCAITDETTATGTTTISGTVTNTNGKTITQNSLVIVNTGSLTTDVDKLVISTGITDNGELILTGTGELDERITGTGIVNVNGTITTVVDNLANEGTLGVKASGTLELTSGILTKTIENDETGIVKLNGATLGGVCVERGTLEFAADTEIADASYISAGTNVVDADKTVTLIAGTLDKEVTNNGTVKFAGATEMNAKVNGGTLEIATGTVAVNDVAYISGGTNKVDAGAVMELNAGTLNKEITNAGTVKFNGATLGGAYVTAGTMEFAKDINLDVDYIKADTNIIDSGKTMTLLSNGEDDDNDTKTDTLTNKISGAGNIVIAGNIVSDGANFANSGKLTINEGNTLELTGTGTDAIFNKVVNSNAGTVKLNGATLGSACVTNGILEFAADTTTIADASYIAATTNIIDGTAVVEIKGGELKKDIKKNNDAATGGTVKLADNSTLSVFTDRNIEGTLEGGNNGQTLNMSDSTNINILQVDTLTGSLNLQLDLDMSGTQDAKLSDRLAVKTIADGTSVTVTGINITKDFDAGTVPADEVVNGITYVTENGNTPTHGAYAANCSAITTNNYRYTFFINDGSSDADKATVKGKLNYKVESVEFSLKKFIEGDWGDAADDVANLSLTTDYKYKETVANMAADTQSKSELNINLNGKNLVKDITIDDVMTISTGAKTLNINGGSGSTFGKMDTNFKVGAEGATDGTLNISGTTNLTGKIENYGDVNANGTTTFAGEITNESTGKINVDGTTVFNGKITNAGTLNTKGTTKFTEEINNSGTLITDGTTNFTKDVKNNENGEVTFKGTTTVIGGNLYGGGAYTNEGTLTVNASNLQITNTYGLTNTGTVNLGSGTLGTKISGGQINVNANVTSDVDYIAGDAATVARSKTLTLTADGTDDILIKEVNGDGNLKFDGNISTKVGNIMTGGSNTVTGEHILTLTETGTLEKKISGAGGLKFDGNITTKAANIATSGTNTVASGRTLTVEEGTLSKAVGGEGNIAISGTVKSTVDNLANDGTLGVNANSTLELTSGNLTKTINNDATGTVKLNGAQLGDVCVTDGTLEFAKDITITDASYISAETNLVDQYKTVTVENGTLAKKVDGAGTVAVAGEVKAKMENFGDDVKLSVKSGVLELISGELKDRTIANSGTVKLNGATLSDACVKSGTLEFAANTDVNPDYVAANTNIVDTGVTLGLNNDGNLKKKVQGAGKIEIKGNISTNANNLAVDGGIEVDSGKNLSFIGSGGTLTKNIQGNGTTEFQTEVAVANGVELNTTNNNVTGTLDVLGNIKANNIYFASGSTLKVDGTKITGTAAISELTSAKVESGSKLYIKNAVAGSAYKILAGSGIEVNSWMTDADMGAGFKASYGLIVDTDNIVYNDGEFTIRFKEIPQPEASRCDIINIVSNLSSNNALKSWVDDVSSNQNDVLTQENSINTMANMSQLANVQNGAYAVSNLTLNTTFEHMSVFQRSMTPYSSTPKLYLRNTAMEPGNYEMRPVAVGRVSDVLPVRSVRRVIDEDRRYSRSSYRDDYYAPSRRSYDRDYDYSPKHYHYMSMTDEPDKTIWGTYIHSKETINDMKVGHLKQDSTLKQNGAVVGADLWTDENSFGGIAVTYAKGDVTSSQRVSSVKNDVEHYGVNMYHRQDMGKFSVQFDAGYGKSNNDIKMETTGAENVTLKPKTEAYHAGIKIEEPLAVSDKTTLVPFLGVRYTFMTTKKANSNLDVTYGSNEQNMCSIPVGLSLRSYNQVSDGMKLGTTLEAGYVFNVGDSHSKQKLTFGDVTDTISYNLVDRGQYFIKAAIQAICENMIWELGYHYSKSSKTKDDKWYVNANFDF